MEESVVLRDKSRVVVLEESVVLRAKSRVGGGKCRIEGQVSCRWRKVSY